MLPRIMRPGRLFALVFAVVLASRLPFLGPGYGTDPDAWRVAWSAQTLATTGRYEASRFPGYPLQEILSALLIGGGPAALAGATAVMSAIAAGCFALILLRLGAGPPLAVLAGLAMASAPAVYLASVQAMDYAWALAFALAALLAAMGGRAVAAGLLAGLAIGCRLPSAGWLAPVVLALADATPPERRRRAGVTCAALALAVGAAWFVPVYATHGPGFFRFYQHGYPGPLVMIKLVTADLWGLIGTAAIGLALAGWLVRRPRDRALPAVGRATWIGLLAGLAVFVAAFLRLPIKAFYLIPAVPLVLLLLGRCLGRAGFAAVCLALLASPWLLKVTQLGRPDEPAFAGPRAEIALPGPYALDLLHGAVITDHGRRTARTRYVDRTLERAFALERESVVVAWDWLPELRVRLEGKEAGRVRFVYLIPPEEMEDLTGRGIEVYTLAGVDWENGRVNGFAPTSRGARPLHPGDR